MGLKFFRVRNFEKFQHYKDRNPPWIKLYRSILDDPRFFNLAETDRFLLLGLFILASQNDNRMPADQAWLKTKLLTKRAIPLELLVSTEWLEWTDQSASTGASKHASKPDSNSASKHASNGASTPLAFARSRETETEEQRQKTEREPEKTSLGKSVQNESINRSLTAAGGRSKVTPETLENVWAAIQQQLRKLVTPEGFAEFWAPLKLLSFDKKFLTVTCPYDPGDDKAWMEKMILEAAIKAGQDRDRGVCLAILLPDLEEQHA